MIFSISNILTKVRGAMSLIDEIRQTDNLMESERNKIQSAYTLLLDADDQLVIFDMEQGAKGK